MTVVKGVGDRLYGNMGKMGILKAARECMREREEERERRRREERGSTPGSVVEKASSLKFSPQPLTVAFSGVLALDSGPWQHFR